MKTKKIIFSIRAIIIFLTCCFFQNHLKAQGSDTVQIKEILKVDESVVQEISRWRQYPILENIAFQDEQRQEKKYYAGIGLGSYAVGYHFSNRFGVSLIYHPNNRFKEGDEIGLGYGQGTAGNDYHQAKLYGQTDVRSYENFDKHTVTVGLRYYLISSFFLGTGFAIQSGSYRTVIFETTNRTIGGNTYDNLSANVRTELKDQITPYLSVGFHHQINRLGLFITGHAGFLNKKLEQSEITFNQDVMTEDQALFEREVRRDANSEGFGIFTGGVTFNF